MKSLIPQAMKWKYGVNCSKNAAGDDIESWESKDIQKPGKDQIAKDVAEYEAHLQSIEQEKALREAYDPIGDQLDRITKTLKHLHANGIDVGPNGIEQIKRVEAVKARFSKK